MTETKAAKPQTIVVYVSQINLVMELIEDPHRFEGRINTTRITLDEWFDIYTKAKKGPPSPTQMREEQYKREIKFAKAKEMLDLMFRNSFLQS